MSRRNPSTLPAAGLVLLILTGIWVQLPDSWTLSRARELPPALLAQSLQVLSSPSYLDLHQPEIAHPATQVQTVATDAAHPSAPEQLRAIDQGIGEAVTLSWHTPLAQDYTSFELYRAQPGAATADAAAEQLLAKDVTTTTYVDTHATTGQTFVYRVRGVVEGATSDFSTPATVKVTDVTPPPAPTNVVAKNTGTGKTIQLTWELPQAQDLQGVRIYRSDEFGSLGSLIADGVTDTTYTDSTLPANYEAVYYTLTSVDTHGNESPTTLNVAPVGNPQPFQPLYE